MDTDKLGKAFLGKVGLEAGNLHVFADAFEHLPFCHPVFETRFKRVLTSNMFDVKEVAMKTDSNFLRRIGPDPHANGARTAALQNCPDIWELESGDFAVIGIDMTKAKDRLPPTANCGPDERIVWIPRGLLVGAKRDIPEKS